MYKRKRREDEIVSTEASMNTNLDTESIRNQHRSDTTDRRKREGLGWPAVLRKEAGSGTVGRQLLRGRRNGKAWRRMTQCVPHKR